MRFIPTYPEQRRVGASTCLQITHSSTTVARTYVSCISPIITSRNIVEMRSETKMHFEANDLVALLICVINARIDIIRRTT